MKAAIRTVAKELEGLVAGVTRRGTTRRGAADVTTKVAADVLGTDVAHVGSKAKALVNLRVKGGGSAAKPLAKVTGDDAARLASNITAGDKREAVVEAILQALFPKEKGFVIKGEAYLRDRHNKIAHDAVTGQSRRIDFAIFKGNQVWKLLEVTSEKVNKAFQMAKEQRMRRHGGRYMMHPVTGERVRIAAEIKTTVIRLP